MKNGTMFFRLGVLAVAVVFFVTGQGELKAQPPAEAPPPAKSGPSDQLTQAELLKAYFQVREQLHAAQLSVANNRAEAEATARAQAVAITEKLEALKLTMSAERETDRARQQFEAQQAAAERERQQAELKNSNRSLMLVVGTFGGVSLIAILLMPVWHWRTVKRIAELTPGRAQLPAPSGPMLLPSDATAASDQAVSASNQRLLSVIDRMERRIFELEHTAVPSSSNGTAHPHPLNNGSEPSAPRNSSTNDQVAWIAVLLAKGRSLLTMNKAKEAVACYDEILKLDANHAEALVKKGSALERLMRNDEAIRCYDRAIDLDRGMTLAYLSKGGVCNRLGRYAEALHCYEQALQAEEEGK